MAAVVVVPAMATLDEAVAMLQDMLPTVLLGSEDSLLDTLGATVSVNAMGGTHTLQNT